MSEITFPTGVGNLEKEIFKNVTSLKVIYVPAKKTEYYKERLPEELHALIVEKEPEKKK